MAEKDFKSQDDYQKFCNALRQMANSIIDDFKTGKSTVKESISLLNKLEYKYSKSYSNYGHYTPMYADYVCCLVEALILNGNLKDDDKNGFVTMVIDDTFNHNLTF